MNKNQKNPITIIIGKETIDLKHAFVVIWVYFLKAFIKLIYFISGDRELEIKRTYWYFSVSVFKFLLYDIIVDPKHMDAFNTHFF